MKKSTTVWIWVIIIIIILIVIGFIIAHNNSQTQTPVQTSTSTSAPNIPANTATLNIMNNGTLGNYLDATDGMTLYTYDQDTSGVSNCTGSCATAWPPYTISTAAVSLSEEPGITGSISTITRADGTIQVTYNGMPLYFWQGDNNPGDINGQGVNGFSVAKP